MPQRLQLQHQGLRCAHHDLLIVRLGHAYLGGELRSLPSAHVGDGLQKRLCHLRQGIGVLQGVMGFKLWQITEDSLPGPLLKSL